MSELEKLKRKTKKLRIIEIMLLIIITFILIFFEQIANCYNDLICNDRDDIDKATLRDIEMFNAIFTIYIGERVDYSIARDCIVAIKTNNERNLRYVNCNITNITELERKQIYNIDCDYDSDGYINYIIIAKEGE